jgi:sucrose-6-phosphate hydrolase SacC (GH32 family)
MAGRHEVRVYEFGFIVAALFSASALADEDVVFADFEGRDFGGWKSEGDAFGSHPAPGPWPGQYRAIGYLGSGLANSMFNGDRSRGRLRSPEFKITHPTISFLVGGGENAGLTRIELLVDGKAVRATTGPNRRTVGRDELEPDHWDVREFLGKTARIELVDEATEGPWGHLLVDQIVFEARPRASMAIDAKNSMQAEKKYLLLPIGRGLPKRRVMVFADGVPVHYLQLGLADRAPSYWADVDVSAHRGHLLTVQVDRLPSDSQALERIELSEASQPPTTDYREPLRPQIHFSPAFGWMNDPNGLVVHEETFHVFFQHNPFGVIPENKHWGHAVSKDLIHWKQLDAAIAPDASSSIWSGSGLVDEHNDSRLGNGTRPPIVLIYTAGGATTTQGIAFSNDGGATFKKWEGNPVTPQISHGNRDPKVIWHEPTKRWVMALYVGLQGDGPQNPGQTIHFLSSSDLKHWKIESYIEGFWECPDLFELPIDDDPADRKWVITGAGGEYAVGDFDGKKFTPSTGKLSTFNGRTYYAGQSFNGIPATDGRTIRMHWLRLNSSGPDFKHALSVPLEVKLRRTPAGLRMTSYPVQELEALRGVTAFEAIDREVAANTALSSGDLTGPIDIELEAGLGPSASFDLEIYGTRIHCDAAGQQLSCDNVKGPIRLIDGVLRLRVIVDVTSLEIFAQGGEGVFPVALDAPASRGAVRVRSRNQPIQVKKLSVFTLNSIWRSRNSTPEPGVEATH